MQSIQRKLLTATLSAATFFSSLAAEIHIGIADFRECVQESKIGQHEQKQFEEMRGKLEDMLEEKEKRLAEISDKFQDPDYVDSLTPSAEQEVKAEYGRLSQEMAQLQNQYMQVLNQANAKIVQKLAGIIANASEKVAENEGLDLVLNQDGTFYFKDSLNVTKLVIKEMDRIAPGGDLDQDA